ncbi:hypothetical protein TNCV_1704751 [Trichonephila clavipes]|nr:hypothetical protein TNCV_1704751 [Trichonephila clavipes]
MRTLAGARVTDQDLKSLWIQRLPVRMQQILVVSSDSLELLGESHHFRKQYKSWLAGKRARSTPDLDAPTQRDTLQHKETRSNSKRHAPNQRDTLQLIIFLIPSLVECVGITHISVLKLSSASNPGLFRETKCFPSNETRIPTFSRKELTPDLGLHRLFSWSFFLDDAKKPFLRADFLQHYSRLVPLRGLTFFR